MSEYSDKLKDPRWQRKRLEIMRRDGFACRLCSATEKTLHVHHLWYIRGREPWDYLDSSLITLCLDCHEEEHASGAIDLIRALKLAGATNSDLMHITIDVDFVMGFEKGRPLLRQITQQEWALISEGIGALLRIAHHDRDLAGVVSVLMARGRSDAGPRKVDA